MMMMMMMIIMMTMMMLLLMIVLRKKAPETGPIKAGTIILLITVWIIPPGPNQMEWIPHTINGYLTYHTSYTQHYTSP